MVLIYEYICYKLELQTNWLHKFFFQRNTMPQINKLASYLYYNSQERPTLSTLSIGRTVLASPFLYSGLYDSIPTTRSLSWPERATMLGKNRVGNVAKKWNINSDVHRIHIYQIMTTKLIILTIYVYMYI